MDNNLKPWSLDWKKLRMLELYNEWKDCKRCGLCNGRNNVVFGEGALNADVVIIGKAPGEVEDNAGRLLVGQTGIILHEFFVSVGIENYFITNTVMCCPPDRAPSSIEKKECAVRLYREIYIIDPLVIVAAGKDAFQMLAGSRTHSLLDQNGETFPCELPGVKFDITYDVMPIYHPDFLRKNDKQYTSGDKKGQWKPGGVAEKVYKALHMLKSNLDNLKRHHAVVLEKHRREEHEDRTE
jgi:uracil-DNA glycosylase family 4